MTAQKNQIQALIAEIDGILGKASPNLPWVMSRDAAEQRQLLGRIRGYLLSLQKAGPESGAFPTGLAQSLGGYDIHAPAPGYPTAPAGSVQQEAAQQILQAVVQEMGYLRANLTQPLQADIEALRQQRDVLLQEVRQLEAQRQQYGLLQQQVNQQQMLNEFLQVLMGRLQENLAQQITQSLAALNAQTLPYGTAPGLDGAYSAALNAGYASDQVSSSGTPLLSPAQRLDHLQSLQAQSDHLLISLDSSLSVVFEALQRNIQSYQDSLSQGIEKMHSLGYQGEVMFTALVNHLAQQLGREASSFLQSATQPTGLNPTAAAPLPPITPTVENVAGGTGTTNTPSTSGAGMAADRMSFKLPYPGSELPLPTSALDLRQKAGQGPDSTSLKDLDLEDLDLSDLNLNEPDLTLLDSPNLDTLLDLELNAPALEPDAATAQQGQSSRSDVQPTVLEISELPLLDAAAALTNLVSDAPAESTVLQDDESVDTAALEFLEQLSAALEETPAPEVLDSSDPEPSVADAEVAPPVVDERIYEELDDFYATLFGEESSEANAAVEPEQTVLQSDATEIATVSAGEEEATELVELSVVPSQLQLQTEASDVSSSTQLEEVSLEDVFFGDEDAPPVESVATMEVAEAADGDEDLPLDLTSLFAESAQPISSAEAVSAVNPDGLVNPSEPSAPPPGEDLSLENFFFGEDAPPGKPTSASAESAATAAAAGFEELPLDLTSLFGEPEAPQTPVVPAVNVVRDDTLELLSSLLGDDTPATPKAGPAAPSMGTGTAVGLPAPDGESSVSGFGEDSYIPAAPDENLLAADMQADESDLDLSINPSTLQRLSEDLSSLEGLENLDFQDLQMAFSSSVESATPAVAQPLPQQEEPETSGWDNLTLNDFADALPSTSEDAQQNLIEPVGLIPEASAVAPEPQGLTLEHIDDLFGDLPSVPPASTERSSEALGGLEMPASPISETPMTLDDVFGDFLGPESEPDQKKKVP